MTIENIIDQDNKIILTLCSGVMVPEDFDIYVLRIWSDATYFEYNEIFDATHANWDDFDFSHLLAVAKKAAMNGYLNPNSKLAWVISEGKQKALTEFYTAAKLSLPVNSREFKPFYNQADAMKWLLES
ncbi:MAG: hypothetical protein OEW97_08300 [Gammaproteobacteria bacterium]|nr:hypothetical protein [Gammaproteobacteria bacterium]